VAEFDVCQCNKRKIVKVEGSLQPLPISPAIWRDISMDFIVGLPKSGNKSDIMVAINHISKYAHLCSLQHPFTTAAVAQIFMDNTFKLHCMPHSIVSDQDLISRAIFGKKCSGYRDPNYILAQPIIPRLMAKRNFSTSVWKNI
jgi:hypothetical protein